MDSLSATWKIDASQSSRSQVFLAVPAYILVFESPTMASASSPRPVISFGAEIECILIPIENKTKDKDAVRNEIADRWNKERAPNWPTMRCRQGREPNKYRNFTEYTIFADGSISWDEDESFWSTPDQSL